MTAVKEKKKALPVKHKVIADIIRVGKENATLLSDIMILANIRDNRQAYLIIEELINKYGYVIVASRRGKHRGYYYPANECEFKEAVKPFRSSVNSMQKRYNNLIRNFKKGN